MTGEKTQEIIERIAQEINQAEINGDPYGLIEARRLLLNDLPRSIQEEARRYGIDLQRTGKQPRRR